MSTNFFFTYIYTATSLLTIVRYALIGAVVCVSLFVPSRAWAATLSASSIILQTNTDRITRGAKPLRVSAVLSDAAQQKAEDMIARGYFSHTDPSGVVPWSWFTQAGYAYVNAGENLAQGYETPFDVENAWMRSPGHRKNILNRSFTQIGVGIARGDMDGHLTTVVVQFFAKPAQGKSVPPLLVHASAQALASVQ